MMLGQVLICTEVIIILIDMLVIRDIIDDGEVEKGRCTHTTVRTMFYLENITTVQITSYPENRNILDKTNIGTMRDVTKIFGTTRDAHGHGQEEIHRGNHCMLMALKVVLRIMAQRLVRVHEAAEKVPWIVGPHLLRAMDIQRRLLPTWRRKMKNSQSALLYRTIMILLINGIVCQCQNPHTLEILLVLKEGEMGRSQKKIRMARGLLALHINGIECLCQWKLMILRKKKTENPTMKTIQRTAAMMTTVVTMMKKNHRAITSRSVKSRGNKSSGIMQNDNITSEGAWKS